MSKKSANIKALNYLNVPPRVTVPLLCTCRYEKEAYDNLMMLVTNIVDMANNYQYTGYYSLLKTCKQNNGILLKKLIIYSAIVPSHE